MQSSTKNDWIRHKRCRLTMTDIEDFETEAKTLQICFDGQSAASVLNEALSSLALLLRGLSESVSGKANRERFAGSP